MIDRNLAVIGGDKAVAGRQDAVVGVGEVALGPIGRAAVRGPLGAALLLHAGGGTRTLRVQLGRVLGCNSACNRGSSLVNRRAAETELRLKRLYDAIESGVAGLDDPALKERIAGLKAIRDQAKADAERAQAALEGVGREAVTPAMVRKLAAVARERMTIEGGGYRRDYLRALAQRVEVGDREVRIMGSKTDLLRILTAAAGVKSAAGGVRSSVLNWRMGWDSNPR